MSHHLLAPRPRDHNWLTLWKKNFDPMWKSKELTPEIGVAKDLLEIIERIAKKGSLEPEWAMQYRNGLFYPFPVHHAFTIDQAIHGGAFYLPDELKER